jgi:hypothetical protein
VPQSILKNRIRIPVAPQKKVILNEVKDPCISLFVLFSLSWAYRKLGIGDRLHARRLGTVCRAAFLKNSYKKWHIFSPRKAPAKHHAFTINPPQLHHDLPPQNTQKSGKKPAKLPFCPLHLFLPLKS